MKGGKTMTIIKAVKVVLTDAQKTLINKRYGRMAWPIIKTIERVVDAEPLRSLSELVEHAMIYLDDHFGGPNVDADAVNNIE